MEEDEVIVKHQGYSEYWYVNYNGNKSCTQCYRIIAKDKCKCFEPPPPPIIIDTPDPGETKDRENSENSENSKDNV